MSFARLNLGGLRLKNPLYSFDALQDTPLLCGVDEAGRGPLCGPVCCAAVILDRSVEIDVNDSKKLSQQRREAMYQRIVETAIAYSIVMIDNHTIDDINILAATMLGMKNAVEGLSEKPTLVLVDGNRLPDIDITAKAIVKGDSISANIAAASILAKVTRDRYMLEMHEQYPEYGYDRHKGYGTTLHYQKLREYGVTEIYRKSFLKKFNAQSQLR